MKLLFLDVETTGLDATMNDIVQLAFIMEIDGEVKEEWCSYIRPHNPNCVSAGALASNNLTMEQILSFPTPKEVLPQILSFFAKYFNPRSPEPFVLAGQNVPFDKLFLEKFLHKCGYARDAYSKLFMHHTMDLLSLTNTLQRKGLIPFESNLKLQTLLVMFGIEVLKAHDAMEDIRGTRKLLNLLTDVFIKTPNEFNLEALNPETQAYKYLTTLRTKLTF